jgi:hypothetical protein
MRAPRRALAVPLALAAVAPALAGCGGNEDGTTSQAAVPTVVTQPPADAVLAQRGRIQVEDLGQGWRSDGRRRTRRVGVPGPPDRRPAARRHGDLRPLPGGPAADRRPADDAGAARLPAAHAGGGGRRVRRPSLAGAPDLLGAGLASALQDVVADAGTVEPSPWVDLAWPATGDHTVGMGLNLTVRSPDGTTRPVAFAIVVTQLGRGCPCWTSPGCARRSRSSRWCRR